MAEVARNTGGVTFDFRTEPPMKEFQFRVSRFTEGISDWTTALSACGQLFQRHMGMQFETEGEASGEGWDELSPAYKEWKDANFPGEPIGVLYGYLRSSMTGGGGYSENIGKTSADYGMSPTSLAIEYGADFAEDRPVIRMTPEWGREYQKVMHQWLIAEERNTMSGGAGVGEAVRLGGIAGNVKNVDWAGAG